MLAVVEGNLNMNQNPYQVLLSIMKFIGQKVTPGEFSHINRLTTIFKQQRNSRESFLTECDMNVTRPYTHYCQ